MAKRKQITVYINTKDNGGDDIAHTEVSTYKESLADIYFLEDKDGDDFHYCVAWGWGPTTFDGEQFDTELEALRHVCRKAGLTDRYKTIRLCHGYYANSERGAITFDGNESINLAESN